ncbi:MAG TPA: DUF802 domain-containing protein, partial [Pusillimonas sp.]|uniref:DUF802 domain-containing protein n=1 Tax=Pusillimonas sp. TaxID=3040095 RepID=UPI002BF44E6F
MNRVIYLLVFVVGLAVALWVGAGYVGSNLLALAVTAIIVAAYSFGGLELLRFRQATQTLDNALSGVESGELNVAPGNVNASTTPTSSAEAVEAAAPPDAGSAQLSLGPGPAANASTAHTFQAWLSQLDPTLRDTVRLRVEGERVGLPGPTLTPYLVGLLVLLGMLGTFLGMVATLRGTGLALEHATDLQAIRASLAAPVKGLGFAFGTSVAGVAASAMLGLIAALARRDRIRAGRRLDAAVAGALRVFSRTHQRDESFKLMQQHAQALPVVAERLQTMIEALESRSLESVEQLQQRTSKLDERLQQNAELLHQRLEARAAEQDARLLAGHDALNAKLTELYSGLTASVEKSLAESLAETGNLVGAAIQPVVESTLAGLARESAALQSAVQQSVQQQLESLSGRFEQSTTKVAGIWTDALAEHQRVSEAQLQAQKDLGESLIEQHQLAGQSLVEQHKSAGEALIQTQQRAGESWASDLRSSLDSVSETFAQRSSAMVDGVAERLDAVSTTLSAGWQD